MTREPWRNDTLLMQRCRMTRSEAQRHLRLLNRRSMWSNAALGAAPGLLSILWFIIPTTVLWQFAIVGDWPMPSFLAVAAITIVPYVIVFTAFMIWFIRRQRRRVIAHIETPLCFKCGYTLSHLPRDSSPRLKCPECGHQSPISHPGSAHAP